MNPNFRQNLNMNKTKLLFFCLHLYKNNKVGIDFEDRVVVATGEIDHSWHVEANFHENKTTLLLTYDRKYMF